MTKQKNQKQNDKKILKKLLTKIGNSGILLLNLNGCSENWHKDRKGGRHNLTFHNVLLIWQLHSPCRCPYHPLWWLPPHRLMRTLCATGAGHVPNTNTNTTSAARLEFLLPQCSPSPPRKHHSSWGLSEELGKLKLASFCSGGRRRSQKGWYFNWERGFGIGIAQVTRKKQIR